MGNEAKLYVSDTIWEEWDVVRRESSRLISLYREHQINLTTNPQGLLEAMRAAKHRLKVRQ